jgi:hypothetical protein
LELQERMPVQVSLGRFSIKADKGRESTDTSTLVPLTLRSPNYSRAAQMEAYYKAESRMTILFGQHTSLKRSRFALQPGSG